MTAHGLFFLQRFLSNQAWAECKAWLMACLSQHAVFQQASSHA